MTPGMSDHNLWRRLTGEGREGVSINKDELVGQIATKTELGRREAAQFVDAFTSVVKTSVAKGDKVSLVGFGTFERRTRNARTARNPKTGAPVKVPKTNVPAFKPGADFKTTVSGKRATASKAAAGKKTTGSKSTGRKTTAKR